MPCAKLSITNDIIRKIKKKTNGICSETSAHIIVIPVMSFSSRFPFRPKGERIANITIYWKKLKKINIKKFHSIINKFNNYIKNEYGKEWKFALDKHLYDQSIKNDKKAA